MFDEVDVNSGPNRGKKPGLVGILGVTSQKRRFGGRVGVAGRYVLQRNLRRRHHRVLCRGGDLVEIRLEPSEKRAHGPCLVKLPLSQTSNGQKTLIATNERTLQSDTESVEVENLVALQQPSSSAGTRSALACLACPVGPTVPAGRSPPTHDFQQTG